VLGPSCPSIFRPFNLSPVSPFTPTVHLPSSDFTTGECERVCDPPAGVLVSAQMGVPKEVMEPTPLAITVHCLHEL
jgi:hypothetical protein